jgi:hypothetical protein
MSDGALTAEDVRSATFGKPPLGKRGHHEHEIDALPGQIAATIEGRGNQ